MIIKFEVENYLSFKDRTIFDLTAANIDKLFDNVYESDGAGFLKSVILYGANASGKSNLFRAMLFLTDLIKYSQRLLDNDSEIPRIPYLLDEGYNKKPTYMSITVLCEDDTIYEYHLTFDIYHIIEEELNRYNDEKEAYEQVFKRDDNISYDAFDDGESKEIFIELMKNFLRKNSLLLSVLYSSNVKNKDVMQFVQEINGHQYLRIQSDFRNGLRMGEYIENIDFYHMDDIARRLVSKKKSGDNAYLDKINCIIKAVDVDIEEIYAKEVKNIGDEDSIQMRLFSKHRAINAEGEEQMLICNVNEFESKGTKEIIRFALDYVDAIDHSGVIIFDGMDISLHPLLAQMVIKLINSEKLNRKGQLIFSSHDISLIDDYTNLFRCDQIYFCEKIDGSSEIYSLFDIKGANQKAENFGRNYIRGKYKAIPLIADIAVILKKLSD